MSSFERSLAGNILSAGTQSAVHSTNLAEMTAQDILIQWKQNKKIFRLENVCILIREKKLSLRLQCNKKEKRNTFAWLCRPSVTQQEHGVLTTPQRVGEPAVDSAVELPVDRPEDAGAQLDEVDDEAAHHKHEAH